MRANFFSSKNIMPCAGVGLRWRRGRSACLRRGGKEGRAERFFDFETPHATRQNVCHPGKTTTPAVVQDSCSQSDLLPASVPDDMLKSDRGKSKGQGMSKQAPRPPLPDPDRPRQSSTGQTNNSMIASLSFPPARPKPQTHLPKQNNPIAVHATRRISMRQQAPSHPSGGGGCESK